MRRGWIRQLDSLTSAPSGRNKIDHLTIISPIHTEVPAIDGKYLGSGVAIEVGKEGTDVADQDHRRNLVRAFVAGNRLPARLPARSALVAYTDPPSCFAASTHSRMSAATLRPLWRASSLSCRATDSGSLIVIPFMPPINTRVTPTRWQRDSEDAYEHSSIAFRAP